MQYPWFQICQLREPADSLLLLQYAGLQDWSTLVGDTHIQADGEEEGAALEPVL